MWAKSLTHQVNEGKDLLFPNENRQRNYLQIDELIYLQNRYVSFSKTWQVGSSYQHRHLRPFFCVFVFFVFFFVASKRSAGWLRRNEHSTSITSATSEAFFSFTIGLTFANTSCHLLDDFHLTHDQLGSLHSVHFKIIGRTREPNISAVIADHSPLVT